MTPKGHAIPSKTQLLSYGTPAFCMMLFLELRRQDLSLQKPTSSEKAVCAYQLPTLHFV